MVSLLASAYPLEACGLLAGNSGLVRHLYPVTNRLASPFAFEMDPQEQVSAMVDLEGQGWELLAIYHSHPLGPPTPSPTDVAKAYYPDAIQVIVSFHERPRPSVRGFAIAGGRVKEVTLDVV